MVRDSEVVTHSDVLKIVHEGEEVVLQLVPTARYGRGGTAFRDSLISTTVRLMRLLLGTDFAMHSVALDRGSRHLDRLREPSRAHSGVGPVARRACL
jgi:hypothetical protein